MYRITTLCFGVLFVLASLGWMLSLRKVAAIQADRDNLEQALRYWTDRHEAVGASPVAVYEASSVTSAQYIERASAVAGSAGTASAPPYDVTARPNPYCCGVSSSGVPRHAETATQPPRARMFVHLASSGWKDCGDDCQAVVDAAGEIGTVHLAEPDWPGSAIVQGGQSVFLTCGAGDPCGQNLLLTHPEDQPIEWTFYKTKPPERFCHSKRLLLEAGGFRIEAWICDDQH